MSRSLFALRCVSHVGPISPHVRGLPRALGAALGVLAVLSLGGCPDPEAKFDEFLDNTKDDRDFMPPPPPPPPDLGPMLPDISGTFLLAVSTVISADLPLQFIVTNTMKTNMDGSVTLDSSLQPLALDLSSVTMPRTPVGDPLEFMNLPIVDGQFEIDAGTVMVTGMANPVTGSDIEATLLMKGQIEGVDFYCGSIEGDLVSPLMSTLKGSTFAAVRLTDPMVLPTDVTINCAEKTVTDM